MAWTIEYTDRAIAQLDKHSARRIVDYLDHRISSLDNPPSTGKILTGPLGGLWRYRVGDYRVICEIQDTKINILMLEAGHRKDVYR